MQCPLCGAANTTGLRYCTRCGGNLIQAAPVADIERVRQTEHGWDIEKIEAPGISVKKLSNLFWAVAVFAMVSLIVLFGLSIPLTVLHAPESLFISLYVWGSITIMVVAGLLIKQVSRLISLMENEDRAPGQAPRVKPTARPRFPGPFRSVTEHTTRNFEAPHRDAGK
ncbi:MAG TPA: hypothetical protein VJZ91_06320, partial [Blastocatellia bacterium]|nr:hypothetical protein [Blastocatellia bacterium]